MKRVAAVTRLRYQRAKHDSEPHMRLRDWTMLLALSVLWGGTFFFVAIALKEVAPLTLVLMRCVIAAFALAPILLLLGYAFPNTREGWRDFAIMSILNNIIPFGLIFYGQQIIPSGLAAVLNATTPLMSLLVTRFVAGEAWSTNKLAGILIGLAGVGVLVGPEAFGGATLVNALGMLACLAATLAYGFSGLWSRRLKAYPAPVSAASQMICSSLLLIPIAGITDRFWTIGMPSQNVLLAIAALGILSTALAYILFFEIIRSAGALNAMLVTLLIPVTSITLGALYLGEALSTRQFVAAAIIGLSLLVIDGRLFGIKPQTG
jgi:drug/metabolite transporter (DMT)-like permease